MKYRDHRGSLSDSMSTIQEVFSIDNIKQHLNKNCDFIGKSIAEIKFKHIGIDNRIDWETYYVLQRFDRENEFTVVGMSDGYF